MAFLDKNKGFGPDSASFNGLDDDDEIIDFDEDDNQSGSNEQGSDDFDGFDDFDDFDDFNDFDEAVPESNDAAADDTKDDIDFPIESETDSQFDSSAEQYSDEQYSEEQYSEEQYSEEQYSEEQYSEEQYSEEQYPEEQYDDQYSSNEQYDEGQYDEGQYDEGQYDEGQQYSEGASNSFTEASEESEETKLQEKILYVITDRPKKGLVNYMRESGLAVSSVFGSIEDARGAILMQTEPYVLVIVDTGLGRFTTTNQRKELIDILGVCGEEDNDVYVFFTDSVIQVEATRELGKDSGIIWNKYISTAAVVGTLLKLQKETSKFILDNPDPNDEMVSREEVMKFKGLTSRIKINEQSSPLITPDLILRNMLTSEEDVLEGYVPNL